MTDKAIDTTPSSEGNSSKPKTKLDKPKGNQTIVNPQYDEKPDPEAIVPFGSNINESKALTALQRLHRAQAIRRIQPKMKMARERAASRKADDKKIAKRSMRKARDIARDRIAGNSGRKYAEMSTGEKIQIDKRLEDKVGLIRRIAKRLIPVVRKQEADRFAAYTHKDMVNTDKLPHTKMTVKAKSLKEEAAPITKTGDYARHLADKMAAHHGETYEHPRWGTSAKSSHDVVVGGGQGTRSQRESGHFIRRDNYHKIPLAKQKAAEDAVIRSKPKINVKGPNGTKQAYKHGKFVVVDHGEHFSVHSHSKYKAVAESYDLLDGAADQKHTSRYGQKIIVGKDGKRRVVPTAISVRSVEEGLLKKSRLSGIPLEALQEVYARGVEDYDPFRHAKTLTEQQYAFNRVNKFLADRSIDTDVAGRFMSRVRGSE